MPSVSSHFALLAVAAATRLTAKLFFACQKLSFRGQNERSGLALTASRCYSGCGSGSGGQQLQPSLTRFLLKVSPWLSAKQVMTTLKQNMSIVVETKTLSRQLET